MGNLLRRFEAKPKMFWSRAIPGLNRLAVRNLFQCNLVEQTKILRSSERADPGNAGIYGTRIAVRFALRVARRLGSLISLLWQ